MLTVTDAALKALKTLLAQLDISSPIRIILKEGSCRGQTLRLSLCGQLENDLRFAFDGLIFLIDRSLAAHEGAVVVDFDPESERCPCSSRGGGFIVTSERLPQRCGSPGCWRNCALRLREQEESAAA